MSTLFAGYVFSVFDIIIAQIQLRFYASVLVIRFSAFDNIIILYIF